MSMDLSPWPEEERLQALYSYGILDTPSDPSFDLLAKEIKIHFDTYAVAISFIDSDRQWFKSVIGTDLKEVPVGMSFCRYTIQQADAYVIPNAPLDPRFALSPFVVGPMSLRSYIGQTIFSASGMPIGTICVCDNKVRTFTQQDLQALDLFVKRVQDLLENGSPSQPIVAADLKGMRVLVVDDEAELNAIISELFVESGSMVVRASSGRAALIALATQTFDVVLSDIRMPGADGFAFLNQMQKMIINPPLLFFVTGDVDRSKDEVMAKGAAGLLTKPIDERLLLEEISQKLGLKISQSPSRMQSIQASAKNDEEGSTEGTQTSLLAS